MLATTKLDPKLLPLRGSIMTEESHSMVSWWPTSEIFMDLLLVLQRSCSVLSQRCIFMFSRGGCASTRSVLYDSSTPSVSTQAAVFLNYSSINKGHRGWTCIYALRLCWCMALTLWLDTYNGVFFFPAYRFIWSAATSCPCGICKNSCPSLFHYFLGVQKNWFGEKDRSRATWLLLPKTFILHYLQLGASEVCRKKVICYISILFIDSLFMYIFCRRWNPSWKAYSYVVSNDSQDSLKAISQAKHPGHLSRPKTH